MELYDFISHQCETSTKSVAAEVKDCSRQEEHNTHLTIAVCDMIMIRCDYWTYYLRFYEVY